MPEETTGSSDGGENVTTLVHGKEVPGVAHWVGIVAGNVEKYHGVGETDEERQADAERRQLDPNEAPDEVVEFNGNLLTTAGLTRLVSRLLSNTDLAVGNTTARIGVGDGSTAAAIGDTDLSAAATGSHRQFEIMQATFPSQAAAVMTLKSIFTTGEANFAWNEWCIDIGAATVTAGTTVNACMLNRKVISLGTKVSTSAWTFTVTITFS